MRTLSEIADHYGTDKGTAGHFHCYTTMYEALFAPIRGATRKLRLLEIGILDGASLATWSEYFENAIIIGVDIDTAQCVRELPRVTIAQGDAGDADTLTRTATEFGPFDIVIEDASHDAPHQRLAVEVLLPHVNVLGWLIIEDILADHPMHEWVCGLIRGGGYVADGVRAPCTLVQSMTELTRYAAVFRRVA